MAYLFSILISSLIAYVAGQSSFSPARPPAIPLAVRSPYLSTWLAAGSDGGDGGYLAGAWPTLWAGAVTGWVGFVRVDNETYTWMGNPDPLPTAVNQTSFSYTSSRSVFGMQAGPVSLTITFLSPVTPNDLLRQSMPITYMTVEVQSGDGDEHDVQLYTDISAEWVSGDRSQVAQWEYGVAGNGSSQGTAYHKVWGQLQQEFSEEDQQASWGYWYYATDNVQGLMFQSGADTDVRGQFTDNGTLNDSNDTNYRAINDAYPVFAYAVDLGSVGSDCVSTIFTISLAQGNSVQFDGAEGVVSLPTYWTSVYPDYEAALAFFYNDFKNVASMCTDLDNKIASDSNAISSDYTTLTSLALRQAFNALAVVGDESTPYIFLKEISSNGDMQTVDVIFPFIPVMLYLAPSWIKLMLEPIFIYEEAGHFTQGTYALHDLGFFPNATMAGTEAQPVEECGNMLAMALAYAQRTRDTDYLGQHYNTLNQWTDYLVNDSLIPSNQISTDDFAGSLANQTNLALKGIIGIQAMAVIANMTGHAADGSNYTSIASDYINQWQTLGINRNANPPHTTLAYGNDSSHGLLYNLYNDALLQTNLVPTEVYQMQSDFYPTVELTYGVPLDTRHLWAKSDWEMFCAAIASTDTRDMFIGDIAKWINETPTSAPASDLYQADTGDFAEGTTHFLDRPVIGGWFAPLALNQTGIPSE